MSKLAEIFEHKRLEVVGARQKRPVAQLADLVASGEPTRGFRSALLAAEGLALIAEVKKASPSQGMIREDFDPVEVALDYEDAGAHCLSVLTDSKYFQGSEQNLVRVRASSKLPILRKDFIADDYQVLESRAMGADCILLIVAGLAKTQLIDLNLAAKALGMDVLCEVHNEAEAEIALELEFELIGVNNRNLATFETDIATSTSLLPRIAPFATPISESALRSRHDLDLVESAGARGVLIGTTFCAAPDIQSKVKEVMGW